LEPSRKKPVVDYESLDDRQLIHRVSQVDKDALEAFHTRY